MPAISGSCKNQAIVVKGEKSMYVSHLECPKCGKTYDSEQLMQLCDCGAPLLVRYDLGAVQKDFSKEEMLASREGTFACPEGAANLTAALKLQAAGWIKPNEKVVLLNTGSGLKYPETVNSEPLVLEPGDNLPAL
jgi:threonine synthase